MPELNINSTQTIGTDASVVSVEKNNANNPRSVIVIINTSSGGQVISLSIGGIAVAGSGIVLSPGGMYSDSQEGGYWPTQQQITAISNLANGTIAVQERVITK